GRGRLPPHRSWERRARAADVQGRERGADLRVPRARVLRPPRGHGRAPRVAPGAGPRRGGAAGRAGLRRPGRGLPAPRRPRARPRTPLRPHRSFRRRRRPRALPSHRVRFRQPARHPRRRRLPQRPTLGLAANRALQLRRFLPGLRPTHGQGARIADQPERRGRQMTTTVSLIIPTLNEAGSIEAVLKEIPRDVVDEVLIVDGASTDGTPDIVRRLGDRVIQQEGRGYGAAIATGFKHVNGEIIVLADADGPCKLDDIRYLVQRVQDGADLALGSRYLPESGSEDDTLVRYVGNKLFTWTMCKLYGVELTDVLFFYLAIRRDVVRSITATSPGFEYIV